MKKIIQRVANRIQCRPFNGATRCTIVREHGKPNEVGETFFVRPMPNSYTKPMDVNLRRFNHLPEKTPAPSTIQQAFLNAMVQYVVITS